MFNKILSEFKQKYAYDLIVECFGKEAELYAEDYEITEQFYQKYTDRILNDLDVIQGKHVVDVGSGTGVWSILMKLHGAASVTAIEPRRQFSNALQRVSDKHNLDINSVNDFHTGIFNLKNPYDTVVLGGVCDLIPDIVGYLRDLDCKYLCISNGVNEDVFDDCLRVELHHNLYHRGGFNFQEDLLQNDLGTQTDVFAALKNPSKGRYLKYRFGLKYFPTIAEYLQYDIHRHSIAQGVQYWVFKSK